MINTERDPEAWEYIALHAPDTIRRSLMEEAERGLRSTRREEGARLTIGDFFYPIASLWLFHAGLLDNISDETTLLRMGYFLSKLRGHEGRFGWSGYFIVDKDTGMPRFNINGEAFDIAQRHRAPSAVLRHHIPVSTLSLELVRL